MKVSITLILLHFAYLMYFYKYCAGFLLQRSCYTAKYFLKYLNKVFTVCMMLLKIWKNYLLKFAGVVLVGIDIGATFFNWNRQNTVILVKFVIQLILFTCCTASMIYAVTESSFFTILAIFFIIFSSTNPVNQEEPCLCRQPFFFTLARLSWFLFVCQTGKGKNILLGVYMKR